MDQRFAGVPATLPRSEVADVFKRYDLISVAALSGSAPSKILTGLRIDPAVAGMVVLTTITNVVGFYHSLV